SSFELLSRDRISDCEYIRHQALSFGYEDSLEAGLSRDVKIVENLVNMDTPKALETAGSMGQDIATRAGLSRLSQDEWFEASKTYWTCAAEYSGDDVDHFIAPYNARFGLAFLAGRRWLA